MRENVGRYLGRYALRVSLLALTYSCVAALTLGHVGTSAGHAALIDLLLAEDDPVNRLLTTRLLEKRGHRVTAVTSGTEVLDALGRRRFDVVLMDVQLPDLNGRETAAVVRDREALQGPPLGHVPIVAVTAHALASDRERCLEAGMDDYVSKTHRLVEARNEPSRAGAPERSAVAHAGKKQERRPARLDRR